MKINCSYLEIYNENLRDLLDPCDKKLKIYASKKTGIYIKNLSDSYVESFDDILKLLDEGKKVRMVSATNMNKNSSRSHAIFTINYIEKSIVDEKKKIFKSKINIVDLAGSER